MSSYICNKFKFLYEKECFQEENKYYECYMKNKSPEKMTYIDKTFPCQQLLDNWVHCVGSSLILHHSSIKNNKHTNDE